MREKHLAGLRLRVTAENWSGRLVVRSAIDGRATNAGVLRYQPFNGRHTEIVDSAAIGSDTILIEAQTLQSRLRVVEAARTRLFRSDQESEQNWRPVREPCFIGRELTLTLARGERVDIEKIVALYTSRDRAIADARTEALTTLSRAGRFSGLLEAIRSAGCNCGGAAISASCKCGANPTTTPTASSGCTSSTSCRPCRRT